MNCKSTKTPTRPMHLLKFKSFKVLQNKVTVTRRSLVSHSGVEILRRCTSDVRKKMIEYISTYEDEEESRDSKTKNKNEPFVDKTKITENNVVFSDGRD